MNLGSGGPITPASPATVGVWLLVDDDSDCGSENTEDGSNDVGPGGRKGAGREPWEAADEA